MRVRCCDASMFSHVTGPTSQAPQDASCPSKAQCDQLEQPRGGHDVEHLQVMRLPAQSHWGALHKSKHPLIRVLALYMCYMIEDYRRVASTGFGCFRCQNLVAASAVIIVLFGLMPSWSFSSSNWKRNPRLFKYQASIYPISWRFHQLGDQLAKGFEPFEPSPGCPATLRRGGRHTRIGVRTSRIAEGVEETR